MENLALKKELSSFSLFPVLLTFHVSAVGGNDGGPACAKGAVFPGSQFTQAKLYGGGLHLLLCK